MPLSVLRRHGFILTWLAEWSGMLKPMLFTTSPDMWTLQVGLNFLNRGAQVTTPTIAIMAVSC
jgi:ABC-type glycerol-3-phosphate transport system permease component